MKPEHTERLIKLVLQEPLFWRVVSEAAKVVRRAQKSGQTEYPGLSRALMDLLECEKVSSKQLVQWTAVTSLARLLPKWELGETRSTTWRFEAARPDSLSYGSMKWGRRGDSHSRGVIRMAVYETAAVAAEPRRHEMVGRLGFAPSSRRLRAGTSLSKFATLMAVCKDRDT